MKRRWTAPTQGSRACYLTMLTTLVVTKERGEGDTEEKETEGYYPVVHIHKQRKCTHNPPPTPENLTSVTD